jgi:hypothetical protein
MTGIRRPLLQGDDWEEFCIRALEYRHRDDGRFQKVPARFRGDYGIDAFLRGQMIFQFYGDRAGNSASDRSDGQKRKLRTDVPKLRKYCSQIGTLVGVAVSDYMFLVSQLDDKSVVELAAELRTDVCSWDLPFVDSSNFSISVKDIDFLRTEWDLFYGAVAAKLDLNVADPTTDDLRRFREGNDLIIALADKLQRIVGAEHVAAWSDDLVRFHLREVALMQDLRRTGPVWSRVRDLKAEREAALPVRRLAPDPGADLLALCDDYSRQLQAEVGSLRFDHAHNLAWGAAGDWLLRCPLDYQTS